MTSEKGKVDQWKIILILVLVIAFSGALYLVNAGITTKLDNIEAAISGQTSTFKLNIDRLVARIDALRDTRVAPAPTPAPAPESDQEPKPGGN